MTSTPVRQWTPGKGTGAMMAADEAAMMELEEKQDKRQLTPAKTPDREAKKAHTTETRTKEEETGTDVEEMTLLKSDLHNLIVKQQVQENQILYALKTHADQDRLKCASEALAINWMKYKKVTRLEDEYTHRERIIEWCLKEAGISSRFWPAQREYSHQVKADHISPQTPEVITAVDQEKTFRVAKRQIPERNPRVVDPRRSTDFGRKIGIELEQQRHVVLQATDPDLGSNQRHSHENSDDSPQRDLRVQGFHPNVARKLYQTQGLLPRMDYLQFIQRHCKSPYRPKH